MPAWDTFWLFLTISHEIYKEGKIASEKTLAMTVTTRLFAQALMRIPETPYLNYGYFHFSFEAFYARRSERT